MNKLDFVERLSTPLLFLFIAVYALYMSIYKPFDNWDMIGYIAAAKSFEEQDINKLHSFTYNQLKNLLSNDEYEGLVKGFYLYEISTDSSAFKEQLPFYQIRPIYTSIIYLLYKLGVKIGIATSFVSGLAIVLALFFLYLISNAFLPKSLVYVIPLLAIVFGIFDLARYSTPDGLAFLAVILSSYLYLTKRIVLLLILLPLTIGIRSDLILFTIPLSLFIFFFTKKYRWKAICSIFASIVVYVIIGAYYKNPGWSTIFYFTLVQILTHPISMPPTLTVQQYFQTLLGATKDLIINRIFVLYVIVSGYSFYYLFSVVNVNTKSIIVTFRSSSAVLAVVCFVFVLSHFLFFPAAWDRFFTAQYLIGAFSLLVMMTEYFQESNSTQLGHSLIQE